MLFTFPGGRARAQRPRLRQVAQPKRESDGGQPREFDARANEAAAGNNTGGAQQGEPCRCCLCRCACASAEGDASPSRLLSPFPSPSPSPSLPPIKRPGASRPFLAPRRSQRALPKSQFATSSPSVSRTPASSTIRKARASTANRCSSCRKRVGLTGFRCRCGELFCGAHRYSDRHGCSYDYKGAARDAIARENPVVRAAKIVRF
ncbi:hypothetical protein HU200_000966 [Digitaria exilis]|uniref:AN1-type domain-containing protein n=1 Tax=Digitaria exilis TaxID=1010633 RepID=A0A835FZC8_9POAL|nr:hypothetical protein HU200_000966 [Digitaria exilis]